MINAALGIATLALLLAAFREYAVGSVDAAAMASFIALFTFAGWAMTTPTRRR